jgi:4-azaleucine resistance transporter AzlC
VSISRVALAEGWPVMLTSVVVGATYGVLARQAGLGVVETSASSLIVFAGASQFVMIDLLKGGAGAPAVALAVLLINARHLLMGASLRPFVDGVDRRRRALLAYVLVDESFALAIGWFRRGHRGVAYYATIGAGMWLSWNGGTLAGALLGGGIERPERYGVDFAITATFVAIVALGIRHRADVTVAAVAAVVAAALRLAGASSAAVVVAGALAPFVALALVRRDG